MDENKNQDQQHPKGTDAYLNPSDQPTVSSQEQPLQPIGPITPNPFKKRLIILAIAGLVAILLIVLVAVLASNSNNEDNLGLAPAETISATVPEDWTEVPTEYGFLLNIPVDWTGDLSSEDTQNGLVTSTLVVSNLEAILTDENPESSTQDVQNILIGSVALDEDNNEFTLEKRLITLTDGDKVSLAEQGITADEATVQAQRIIVGANRWLKVDFYSPEQTSTTYYTWSEADQQMIYLQAVSTSDEGLKTTVDTYLLPMLSSVELLELTIIDEEV